MIQTNLPFWSTMVFCGECGTENPDTNGFCKNCGKPLKKKQLQPDAVPPPAARSPASPRQVPPSPGPTSPKIPGASKKLVIISAVIVVVIIAAIFLMAQPGSPISGVLAPATKASEPIHGTISTGAMTTAAQGSLSAAGGTITVNQPGSAVNGLKFVAPAGAYPSGQQVTISSAPINGNTFGSNFNPATPMIEINAGPGYADEPILVTIPVNIPDDQFAMAFYYDDVNKKLEGVPTAGQDSKSITIATRHFSHILVSLISFSTLDDIKKVESGFRPGVDTWEFDNPGSYIAPGGYCAGDSVTMMWYYTEQRQKKNAPPLNGRYDNNGREKTPLFPMDDTLGVRFASVMQTEMLWKEYWENPGSMISNVNDSNTFREFKYSMLMTGEPQFVGLSRAGGGHAIVCFEVYDNTLWVADPNYPGKERMITLNGSVLGPYASGENSEDIKKNGVRIYPGIHYIAKSALFSWPTLAAEYAKVQDGTIGDDDFPPYQIIIYVVNNDGTEKEVSRIQAGKNSELKHIDVEGKTVKLTLENPATGGSIQYPDGTHVNSPITLKEGSNILGLNILGTVNGNFTWLGFDWIELNYKPSTTTVTTSPKTTPAATGQMYNGIQYRFLENMLNDAECAESHYADANDLFCSPKTEGEYMFCGHPADKCIDKTFNKGILMKFQYVVKEKTSTNGQKVAIRFKDGTSTYYAADGSVRFHETYKDGMMVSTDL